MQDTVPEYNWDDVTEPTDADLAEIDAAIESAPPVPEADDDTTWAWTDSWAVRKTVELVGYPDGTAEWLIDFTSTLFAFVESFSERTSNVDPDRMYELAKSWRNANGKRSWQRGGQLDRDHLNNLRKMVRAIGMEALARYLDTTTSQVERWLFPRISIDCLRTARDLYQSGIPCTIACKQAGVAPQTYVAWARAWRYPGPQVVVRKNGTRFVMSPEMRLRIEELTYEGLRTKAVLEKVRAEFGTDELKYNAVAQVQMRARQSLTTPKGTAA